MINMIYLRKNPIVALLTWGWVKPWYLNFSSPKMNRTIFTLPALPILVVFMILTHGLYEFLEASKEPSPFPLSGISRASVPSGAPPGRFFAMVE
jgi:hypothetical protein